MFPVCKSRKELHGVTFYHLCGLSWPPPSAALTERDPTVRDLFSDICYLLLAHRFDGGGVMLKL